MWHDPSKPERDSRCAVRFYHRPQQKNALAVTYPMTVGRNFDEILCVIDALLTGNKLKIATPADWVSGRQVIIPPSVPDAPATVAFPQGCKTIRPYLGTVEL